MDFTNRVALVTGGAQGIGKAICEALAAKGARLAVVDIVEETAAQTAEELKSRGCDARAYAVNVVDFDAVKEMITQVAGDFGTIDVLVNNAGITRDNLLIRMKEDEWDAVIAVNLKGVFNCTKAVARPMMKARYGRIVNIASVVGIMGNAGQANYSASKGGVIALTKTSAKELAARNITVNAVAPGYIQTDMTDHLSDEAKNAFLSVIPMQKPGTAQDVANAVCFLASEESAYISGQVVNVDGGMVM